MALALALGRGCQGVGLRLGEGGVGVEAGGRRELEQRGGGQRDQRRQKAKHAPQI